MRAVSLGIFLFLFWLALSGHFTPFLLGMGVLSVVFCVYVAKRMGTIDAEGHPVHLLAGGVLGYVIWLCWEIIKSAWRVTRIILSPRLPISPTMTMVATSQDSPVGIDIYANSITLTPGTITVGVKHADRLIVHALESAGADDLEAGGMDARVTRFEGVV